MTLYNAGKIDESRKLFYKILPLSRAMFYETISIPVKAAMEMMGRCGGELPAAPGRAFPTSTGRSCARRSSITGEAVRAGILRGIGRMGTALMRILVERGTAVAAAIDAPSAPSAGKDVGTPSAGMLPG